ncbi:MAG: hypothetical protein CMD22_03440, partial [Flavobacteriales bacterium]|nr:hypothetical protein [Flavobacteriales bacterium]
MKKILMSLIVILFTSLYTYSNTYFVNSGNFYYSPSNLTVNVGDTVVWLNDGGYHNVNFDNSSITGASYNNPEVFVSSPTISSILYTHIFTIPGNYTYDCSVGSHAVNGMIGYLTVIGSTTSDCNGIIDGTALTDDCGVCQQAYLYDFISHTVTFLADTIGVIPSPTQILVMPDDLANPYWNSTCNDCNAVVNGLAIIDDCGVCQSALVYNYVTHLSTPITDTTGYIFGPSEMLVLPNSTMNPVWNSSCMDCNGVINGTSLLDDCGICQQSYIYDVITHNVTFINDTFNLSLLPTQILVMSDDISNPYWNSNCRDCNGVLNGTSLNDSCGTCQQAYIYDVITHNVTFINDTFNLSLLPTQILVFPNDSLNIYWNSGCVFTDCNGVVNGLAMIDDCGVCQSALVYNYVTHVAIPLTDTAGYVYGPTEMLVLPNSPMNLSWNSSCVIDCNGVANGLAMIDDCGVCQSTLVYNYITHVAIPLTDTAGYVFGPTEILVLSNSPMNPSWNSSCVIDCNGVVNGLAMIDDCGVCQSALVYNYITHVAMPLTDTAGYVFGPTEMLVLPNSAMNPYWSSSCILGCTDPLACNYDSSAVVDDGSCLTVYGCMDPTAFNYDSNATCSDSNSCIAVFLGCLDSTAVNYNPLVNTDDGSCVYPGCTDPLATNYNPNANIDDGTCNYITTCPESAPTGLYTSGVIQN